MAKKWNDLQVCNLTLVPISDRYLTKCITKNIDFRRTSTANLEIEAKQIDNVDISVWQKIIYKKLKNITICNFTFYLTSRRFFIERMPIWDSAC